MRLPAEDPSILKEQLLRELERLIRAAEAPDIQEPWLYQAYLEKFLIEAWMEVSAGNFQAPKDYLRHLTEAEDLVKFFLPPPEITRPHVQAAREVQDLVRILEIAARCLAIRQSKTRAAERQRSETEREVLRVLSENAERHLRRGEIYAQMSVRPTPGRVSQILSGLDREGLLVRIQAPAQGSSETSFFSLSEAGRELCSTLRVSPPPIYFERSGKLWRDLLHQPEAVAIGESQTSGSIVTFYGCRRGIGRSLALAHSALRLAKQTDNSVLVMDLTLEPSELPDYLSSAHFDCRGLRGLLEDYKRQAPENRRTWLESALQDPLYVNRPSPRLPNLYFMPLGIDPVEPRATSDLEGHLLREITQTSQSQDNAPLKATDGFFGDLRSALTFNFGKTLIDAASDLNAIAYAGTTLLPDELVIFLRPNETDFAAPRIVLGNFLWRESAYGHGSFAPVTFIFSALPLTSQIDLRRIVDNLLGHDKQRNTEYFYRILSLFYDPEVAQGRYLVDEEGQWTRYSQEDLLTLGYQNLSDALMRPLPAGNWRIRMQQMERRRSNQNPYATGRPDEQVGVPRRVQPSYRNRPTGLFGKTPPGSADLHKKIRAVEASHGAR